MGRVTLVAAPGSLIAALRDLKTTTINPDDLPTEAARIAASLATTGADVVVFGPDVEVDLALASADELGREYPEIEIVLVQPPSQELLTDAMRAGVREVLAPDAAPDVIGDSVKRIAEAAGLRRQRLAGEGGPVTATPEVQGRLITMMAAKGGVGKTTVAVNLAILLARTAPQEVVLVDLDLNAGDVDLLLDVAPKATIASVATPGVAVDPTVIKLSLTRHPSGLLVLPCPEGLVEADGVDAELLVDTLTMLRRTFKFVVVDTAPGAGAPLAAAAEVADDMLLIATPDIGGLRSLRRNLDGLDQLGLGTARRQLVLNRSDFRTGIGNQTIENTVDLAVSHAIPDEREIAAAANQGVPFVHAFPKSEAVRSFVELAASVGSAPGAKAGESGRTQRHLGVA